MKRSGGMATFHAQRLSWAARIRYVAQARGVSIRMVFRWVMLHQKQNHDRYGPLWSNIEAFENFCAGRRHRARIEALMIELRGKPADFEHWGELEFIERRIGNRGTMNTFLREERFEFVARTLRALIREHASAGKCPSISRYAKVILNGVAR